MKRIMSPMLFLLANTPDVERNLKVLMSVLQATTDSVQNIKSGIDNIQATIMKMSNATAPIHPLWPNPTGQESGTDVKPEPAGPVESGTGPVIQMPTANPSSASS